MKIAAGSTDVSIWVKFAGDDGKGLEGLTADDVELHYQRSPRGTPQEITLTDLSEVDDEHADGGFFEVGGGHYRVDLPDAAVAEGVSHVLLTGAVVGEGLSGDLVLDNRYELDTTGAALQTVDDNVDAVLAVAEKLDDTLEDNSGTYRFTEAALAEAPVGEGGVTDWDADERAAIRAILGIPVSGSTPADPSTGILDTIRDAVATRASQESVDDIPTNSEFNARTLPTADYATASVAGAVKTVTDRLNTAMEQDGAVYRFTANALEQAEGSADVDAEEIAEAILNASIEGDLSFRASMRLQNSAMFLKCSGLDTTTAIFRNYADTKDRITATVDEHGNRYTIVLDFS